MSWMPNSSRSRRGTPWDCAREPGLVERVEKVMVCACCNRQVDRIRIEYFPRGSRVLVTAYCHGSCDMHDFSMEYFNRIAAGERFFPFKSDDSKECEIVLAKKEENKEG